MTPEILPGKPHPLGATFDGQGTNFALYSEGATAVELCLFDEVRAQPARIMLLPEFTGFVWHGYVPNLAPGQLYGYKVHGAFDPPSGQRFNPAKLLIDPYAKAIAGGMDWSA